MSRIDEIRVRHEATLFIDWDKEFNPESQPLSNSNAKQCHEDRAYLLERIAALEANQRTASNNELHVALTEKNKRIKELKECLREAVVLMDDIARIEVSLSDHIEALEAVLLSDH